MKTLVVDDDLINRKIIKKIMSDIGECEAASRGDTAISSFKQAWEDWRPFDLMMLDIAMPETDGIKVLQEIRKLEKIKKVAPDKQVKIVMVTCHTDKPTIVKCIQEGCNGYVTKPFTIDVINEQLEKLGMAKARERNGKMFKTETGHYIIDVNVDEIYSLEDLEFQAKDIPGVLETGLFIGYADRVLLHNGKLDMLSRLDYSKQNNFPSKEKGIIML